MTRQEARSRFDSVAAAAVLVVLSLIVVVQTPGASAVRFGDDITSPWSNVRAASPMVVLLVAVPFVTWVGATRGRGLLVALFTAGVLAGLLVTGFLVWPDLP